MREHGLKALLGVDASRQPGDLKELMLHETAVAWLTHWLVVTTPAPEWDETPDAFGKRLKDAREYINTNNGVDSLCREFPARVRALREAEGGRLPK